MALMSAIWPGRSARARPGGSLEDGGRLSILGNRVLRTEDPRLLTVGGTYVDDLALDDAAHVV
jgi:hypothetical protein